MNFPDCFGKIQLKLTLLLNENVLSIAIIVAKVVT